MIHKFKIVVYSRCLFLVTLFFNIVFSSLISFHNLSFDLYFNQNYINYAKSLSESLSFYPSVNLIGLSTFPLWGYGFVHWVFNSSKLGILIFQQALNFYTIYLSDNFIRKKHFYSLYIWRILVLIAFPYFLFHTQLWPKSISSSLLIIGLIKLLNYVDSKKKFDIIVSGLMFGLVCNFRSDYFYLTFVIPFTFILWQIIVEKKIAWTRSFLILPIITILCLVPWSFYTYKKTDNFLLTSTNTGHTLFIGLGQLPNNIWGITPKDDDIKMKNILISKFKTKHVSSTDYSESEYLKEIFFEFILNHPFEWINKCFFNFRLIFMDPFYVGNVGDFQKNGISNIEQIRAIEKSVYEFDFKTTTNLLFKTNWTFSYLEILQLFVTIITKIIGLFVFLLTFLSCVFILFYDHKWFFKTPFLLLLLVTVLYQLAILIFVFHMPVYNTSIYLIYLILNSLMFEKIFFNSTINKN